MLVIPGALETEAHTCGEKPQSEVNVMLVCHIVRLSSGFLTVLVLLEVDKRTILDCVCATGNILGTRQKLLKDLTLKQPDVSGLHMQELFKF